MSTETYTVIGMTCGHCSCRRPPKLGWCSSYPASTATSSPLSRPSTASARPASERGCLRRAGRQQAEARSTVATRSVRILRPLPRWHPFGRHLLHAPSLQLGEVVHRHSPAAVHSALPCELILVRLLTLTTGDKRS